MAKIDYSQLKSEVILFVSNNSRYPLLFEELKNVFASDINSRRRQEHITTIEELIEVLELRDALCDENVVALRKIVNKFPDHNSITASINRYESAIVRNLLTKTDIKNIPNSTKIDLQFVPNDNLKSVSKRKKDLIFEAIKEGLGSEYWMALGRNIGIREYILNEINSRFNNSYDKASELLERYESKADPYRWFHILCEALENSKRKDLAKEIKNIMIMNA